jgi:DNA mismatch repair protein MutS
VITAAKKYLHELEKRSLQSAAAKPQQELILELPSDEVETHPAVDALASLDPDSLSPREALQKLYDLKALAQRQ